MRIARSRLASGKPRHTPRPAARIAPRIRAARVAAPLIATALILSGCASFTGSVASVALSEVAGFPSDAPIAEPMFGDPFLGGQWGGEPVGWLADDRLTLTIVSFGSSTCPFIATAIAVVDDAELAIELRQDAAQGCTDDVASHTHVFATPDGWATGDGPYSARVSRTLDAFGAADSVTSTVALWPVTTEGESPVTDSIAIDTIRGVPDDFTLPDNALDQGEPLAFWGENRATLRVITWGSSSCPPPVVSLTTLSSGDIAIVFGVLPPVACTADFAPTTHVLDTPEGTTPGLITLAITVDQRDAVSLQYRVPIVD